jgi:hypothetical protein
LDIVKILIKAGADKTIEDLYGKKVEMYAEELDRRGGDGGFFLKALFQIGRE